MWQEMLCLVGWLQQTEQMYGCTTSKQDPESESLTLGFVFYRHTVPETVKNGINFPSLKHLIYSFKSSTTPFV